jgi:hypothetical protein
MVKSEKKFWIIQIINRGVSKVPIVVGLTLSRFQSSLFFYGIYFSIPEIIEFIIPM